MTTSTTPFALFAVATGNDRGFGRLARAGALADALGVDRHVVLRGPRSAVDMAVRLGWTVHAGSAVLDQLLPDVLIVDDGSTVDVSRWTRKAHRLEVPVVEVHGDRRITTGSDLVVDGRFVAYEDGQGRLSGPEFALLDWRVAARRSADDARDSRRVLVALGAGARRQAADVASAIIERVPSLRVDVAAGLSTSDEFPALPEGGRWILAPHGLVPHLASAAVVVTSGGTALYESCALGSPTVAIARSAAEVSVIDVPARAGAVVAGGVLGRVSPGDVAGAVIDLLADPTAARGNGRHARQLVDGRGATRVADAVHQLLSTFRAKRWSHAA